MLLTDFVNDIREHYLGQFDDFVDQQTRSSSKGASEVKLRLSDESEIYQHLYCVDFIKNDDDEPEVIELQPNVLTFEPLSGSFGDAALTIEQLRWDDVVIHHDASDPSDGLAAWFSRWFDPEDLRHDASAKLGNVVHSLLVTPGTLSVDLGTATPDAFWDVLNLLEKAGARTIRIGASRSETDA
jgi:hypothetical protein